MLLLDTDTLSYALRGDEDVIDRLESATFGRCFISVITRYELAFGVRRSPRRRTLQAAYETISPVLTVLPVDEVIAEDAAAVRAELEARGRLIGPIDPLIAATARVHGLTLVTHNTKHFAAISGLSLADWKEPP